MLEKTIFYTATTAVERGYTNGAPMPRDSHSQPAVDIDKEHCNTENKTLLAMMGENEYYKGVTVPWISICSVKKKTLIAITREDLACTV